MVLTEAERIDALELELANLRGAVGKAAPPRKPEAELPHVQQIEEWARQTIAWVEAPAGVLKGLRAELANPPRVEPYQASSFDPRKTREQIKVWEAELSRRSFEASLYTGSVQKRHSTLDNIARAGRVLYPTQLSSDAQELINTYRAVYPHRALPTEIWGA